MGTTATTASQEAVQNGMSGWLVFLVLTCFLVFIYFFVFHPIIMGHKNRVKQARELKRLANSFPRTDGKRIRNRYSNTVESDHRLITEIRTILDRSKLFKEIRPADVRQHLNAKGWDISQVRILCAMDDLRERNVYYHIGYRWTSKGQLIIWRIPEQSDEHTSAVALSHED